MSTGDLEAILRQYRIPAVEWVEWSALTFQAKRPGALLLSRIRRGRRAAAFKAILVELSKQVPFKFPPRKAS